MKLEHEPKLIILGPSACGKTVCARELLQQGFTGAILTGQGRLVDGLDALRLKATAHYPSAQYLLVLTGFPHNSPFTAVNLTSGHNKRSTEFAACSPMRLLEAVGYVRQVVQECQSPEVRQFSPFVDASVLYTESMPAPNPVPEESPITLDFGGGQLVLSDAQAREIRNQLGHQLFLRGRDRLRAENKAEREPKITEAEKTALLHERQLRADGAIETPEGLLYFNKIAARWLLWKVVTGDRPAPLDFKLPRTVWARPSPQMTLHAYREIGRAVCQESGTGVMGMPVTDFGPRSLGDICGACLIKVGMPGMPEPRK